jgi:hypothetical protein
MSNREIKFRAWDRNHLHWLHVDDGDLCDLSWGYECGRVYYTESVIFQQYTGLKDKNGKEIYEGDVLWYSNEDGHHTSFSEGFVVEFGEQCLGDSSYQQTIGWNATRLHSFGKPSLLCSGRLTHGILDLFGYHNVEVIGNIYENPDLIGE